MQAVETQKQSPPLTAVFKCAPSLQEEPRELCSSFDCTGTPTKSLFFLRGAGDFCRRGMNLLEENNGST